MTKIIVSNVGEFHIPNEKVQELLLWLSKQQAVQTNSLANRSVHEVQHIQYPGQSLING
jgi:hypothetical protein